MIRLLAIVVFAFAALRPMVVVGAPLADARQALAAAVALIEQAQAASDATQRERLVGQATQALDAEPSLADWAWLREPLISRPSELDRARARLQAALDLESTRISPGDAAAARAQLADVLSEPRFNPGDWRDLVPGWLLPAVLLIRALLEIAWNIIRWPFDRLLDLLARAIDSPLVVLVGIAAVIGVLTLYRAGIRSILVRQAEVPVGPAPLPPTALEALNAAQQQAAVGRYREACHFVLLSALLTVDERGDSRFDPSATNREHVRRVQSAARPAVARALAPLVSAFDDVWYGAEVVTEADYRGMLDLAGRVREATA